MWNKTIKEIFLLILVGMYLISIPITAYADDREHLRSTLDEQESQLQDRLDDDVIKPESFSDQIHENYDNSIEVMKEQIKNSKGEIDTQGKVEMLQENIFAIAIKTRTAAIVLYVALWIIGLLYAATMGSRDVNKRRKVFLVIRNSTFLFFIYVNIPLFIIWLNSDKSGIQITLYDVVIEMIMFFQKHSVIISCLLGYAGVTRLIISKNNLPVKRQGEYLVKFAIILLIALNIIPIAMYFII